MGPAPPSGQNQADNSSPPAAAAYNSLHGTSTGSMTGQGAEGSTRGWTGSLGVFAAGSVLLIWLFRSEIGAAVRVWRDSETFGHAFFIFPIILFLFFRLRQRLAIIEPIASPWALAPILVLTLLWLLGSLTSLTIVQQLAFVAIWQCFFLLIFGWPVTREALFPLAYLYLAVPFGLSVIPLLQDITAQIVVALLRFTGVPVFLDGYHIEIPDGSFLIAEACSGVRYLIVSIALGILAAYLFFHSWKRRLFFVGLSIAVPIVANGIRAYGIVMIAHLSHYTLAVDVDHIVYGFIFLSLVTLCLLGMGVLLRERGVRHFDDTDRVVAPAFAGFRKFGLQLFCAIMTITTIFSAQFWSASAKAPPANQEITLHGPAAGPSWELMQDEPPLWMPDFRGMDAQLQQTYFREDDRVALYVAYYAYQREGAEAVNDLNAVAREGSVWKILQAHRTEVRVNNRILPINQIILGYKDQTILVWYWYRIGGEVTNSRLWGKLLETKALVTGGERDAAIVAVSAKVAENAQTTAMLLRSFLQQGAGSGEMILQVDVASSPPGLTGNALPFDLMGGTSTP
jgi:exosortase A